jgi:glyoxylase-like metal-dependent hydrolase (beta-lactamase superfamily II)
MINYSVKAKMALWRRLWILLLALSGMAQAAPLVLEPVQVSKHVWFFQGSAGMASQANKGFMSNAGFVVTADGVVVFDALATPALGEAMADAIRKVTKQPIRRVIVSHYHADHFYGLQALKKQGAQVWAHEKARATLESDEIRSLCRPTAGWRCRAAAQSASPWAACIFA